MSATPAEAPRPEWLTTAEKGSVLGIRILVGIATFFGRRAASWVLRLIALYYVTFHGKVRRSLRTYYERLDGSRPGFWRLWRHVFVFSVVALDRFFFARGKSHLFELTHHGREHLDRLAEGGRGAILLSAHVGSQAAMSADGAAERLRINIVGYFRNARMINAVIARLDPSQTTRVIDLQPGSVSSVLTIKERIDRGELLAIAGDRLGINERYVEVDFLGHPARLPTGPFLLALMLRCPIYLVFALYRGGNRYDLHCEPLSEALAPPRAERDAVIAELVARFAERLGVYCRMAPDNWFNFYDFWRRN
ncbi:MAG TPA: lipid A biosynthesis acyltransferase [Myxococcota bacterium]|nr:lipid A biosynthesis acyltransferase [Myxococcota bacterium]